MSRHPEAHEERLANVLGESDDPRRAFEASELASCAECRAQLDEVAELGGLLDAVARDERASLERAAATTGAPGEDRVAEIVARAEGGRRSGARSPAGSPPLPPPLPHAPPPTSDAGMPLRVWVGLAAAALIVFGVYWMRSRPDDPGGVLLGPAGIELVSPLGEVDGFDAFRWSGVLAPGSSFVVRVRDADRPDAGWTESPRLRDDAWTPTDEDRARWAAAIEWEVRVLGAVGEVVESSARQRAWRSSD